MVFRLIVYPEDAFHNVDELGSLMNVSASVVGGVARKLRQIRGHLFVAGTEGEDLKEEAWNRAVGTIWKFETLVSSDNRESSTRSLLGKEMGQIDVEDHSDARQGGQSRDQFSIL